MSAASVEDIRARLQEAFSPSKLEVIDEGHLHIGHSRIDLTKEQFRMLKDPADLADLLVKLRGNATRKQVAEVAGIRPIRLKELEEPGTSDRVDLGALFAVLGAYRTRAGVALRSGR